MPSAALDELLAIMARLRDPQGGCPWDIEQSFRTIAPYTVEEAYEVAEAAEAEDMPHLKEELGDLLLQVVFHARMAEERGAFAFEDVAQAIVTKMIARHPHVFDSASVSDAAEMERLWEDRKAAERQAKAAASGRAPGLLDDVAAGLPGLTRAVKLQKRAARVGFDWTEIRPILAKLQEEVAELEAELDGGDAARIEDEVGDLLFVMANVARRLSVDPEQALRGANAKFARRFRHIEDSLRAAGTPWEATDLEAMEALWQQAKRLERGG